MLLKNTELYLFKGKYALVNDILIDFQNKVLYKIYKISEKEFKEDKFKKLLNIVPGVILVFKTQNYMSKIFGANYSSFIFKQYENEDFLSKTQEQLSKRSKVIYAEFKMLEELYKEFDNELNQRLASLVPKKTVYCFIPLKIGIEEKELSAIFQKYNKESDKYFATYNKMVADIEKYDFKKYLETIDFLKTQNKDAEMILYKEIIEPSLSFVTAKNSQIIGENKKLLSDIESQVPMFPLSGTDEPAGIFDSFFYDEVFLGDKYYNVLTFFNDQIAGLKNGEKYFPIIKKIIKNFDILTLYNNRVLISSGLNNILYFIGASKIFVGKDEDIFSSLDRLQDNFDMIIKIQEVEKSQIIDYIDDAIKAAKLKITTVISREKESNIVLDTTRSQLKDQINYYTSLKNKILDVNEKVYAVSSYLLKRLILKNQESLLSERMKIIGFDARQIIPTKENIQLLFDIKHDISGFFIHTRPIIHFLNPFYNFKNIEIINDDDKQMIENIYRNSI